MLLIPIYNARLGAVNVAQAIALVLLIAMAATRPAQAQSFTLIHTFSGPPDGAYPVAGLIQDAAGDLYGTTQLGGITIGVCANINGFNGLNGCGTVFKLDPTGAETVLYRFTGGADGQGPTAGLVQDAVGNLYGSTGAAVFKLDPAGTFTVLHSPGAYAGLAMDAAGNLYGSSMEGIFKLDAAGRFTVLDGNHSSGTTLARDAAGNLYGTNENGGITNTTCLNGTCGIAFKLDTTGNYTVLHSFTAAGEDGYNPLGGLALDAVGNLYGTTPYGGAPNCIGGQHNPVGCGTVFKLSPSGAETIFNFQGGDHPITGLVLDAAGNLYGTTEFAGPFAGTPTLLFEMDSHGRETELFSFTGGGVDRAYPTASLIRDAAGNLYGTTQFGDSFGAGTVFKLNPTGAATFPFDVAPAGTGAGTVTGDAAGANCSASCTGFYPPGTAITLTATPAAGSIFTGWTGGCTGPGVCHVNTGSAEVVVWSVFDLDFSVSASALTPVAVSPGGSSTSTVNVTPLSSFSGSVAFTCSVQPTPAFAPTCSVSPSPATPGTPATLTVRTTPHVAGASFPSVGNGLFLGLSLPLVALVLAVIGFFPEQKRRNGKYIVASLACVLFAIMIFQVGCAGSSASPSGGGSSGTPAGTYTITVTGTYTGTYPSGTLVHSIPTMLTVQ
jgi:uncharacterized repeat protein (TIGR03803 family)